MKVVLRSVSSSSPGVQIVGERKSLIELADNLRAKLEQIPDGKEIEIPFADSAACGGGAEWISVQVVSDISPAVKVELKKGKRLTWGLAVFFGVVGAVIILAYIGFKSLLP